MEQNYVPYLKINAEKKILEPTGSLRTKFDSDHFLDDHKEAVCQAMKATFQENCPPTWRDHFGRIWNSKVYREVAKRENYSGPTE